MTLASYPLWHFPSANPSAPSLPSGPAVQTQRLSASQPQGLCPGGPFLASAQDPAGQGVSLLTSLLSLLQHLLRETFPHDPLTKGFLWVPSPIPLQCCMAFGPLFIPRVSCTGCVSLRHSRAGDSVGSQPYLIEQSRPKGVRPVPEHTRGSREFGSRASSFLRGLQIRLLSVCP